MSPIYSGTASSTQSFPARCYAPGKELEPLEITIRFRHHPFLKGLILMDLYETDTVITWTLPYAAFTDGGTKDCQGSRLSVTNQGDTTFIILDGLNDEGQAASTTLAISSALLMGSLEAVSFPTKAVEVTATESAGGHIDLLLVAGPHFSAGSTVIEFYTEWQHRYNLVVPAGILPISHQGVLTLEPGWSLTVPRLDETIAELLCSTASE